MAKRKADANKPKRPARRTPASEQIDDDLARSALKKRSAGQTPNQRELAALRRVERRREEAQRWEYYRSIPQKHWIELSGRQAKILKQQAAKYGIPFSEKVIDLGAVARGMHDLLAKYWRRFSELETDEEMLDGATSPQLERWRAIKASREEIRLSHDLDEVVSRTVVHDGLLRIAAVFRTAGDAIQRQFGADAYEILEAAMTEAEREGEQIFGSKAADKKT